MVELAPGQLVTPSIRLNRILGRGGMGSLWVADHLRFQVPVVVKFIASELVGNPEVRARFEREAAATMAAKSAHVVQILDYGFSEHGMPFIAMELLEGEDLAAKIGREVRIAPIEFAEILRQACKGITRAHAQGIVHRDIKPENIFLSSIDGDVTVKVLDFGIAKAANGISNLRATKTGMLLGTAYYMSPEQTMGAKNVDHRTDLWSLGVVTYYALTGVRPFESDSIGALISGINSTPIAPPSQHVPMLGTAFDRWMVQALARDPVARFANAKEMSVAFDAVIVEWRESMQLTPPPVPARATPPGEWDDGSVQPGKGPGYNTLAGLPAKLTPGGSQRLTQTPGTPGPRFNTSTSGVVSLAQNVTHAKRSYGPLLIGVGIGVAVCIVAFVAFWGRGTTQASQATADSLKSPPVDSRAAAEISPAQVSPSAERLPSPTLSRSHAAPESTSTPTPAPSPVAKPALRAVAGSAGMRTPVGKYKPAKRSPAHNDNPFNGSY